MGDKSDFTAILVSFVSPKPLEKGSVFDVDCREAKTGDGVFLSGTFIVRFRSNFRSYWSLFFSRSTDET